MGSLYCVVPASSQVLWNSQHILWCGDTVGHWTTLLLIESLKGILLQLEYVSACVLTRGRACLWTRMWKAETDFLIMSHLIYRAGLLAEPNWLIWLCSQPACPRDFLSQPSLWGEYTTMPPASMWVSGIRSPALTLAQGFIHWASPSSPSPILPVRSFQHYYSNVKPSQHPHYFPFPCLLAPLVFPSFHCSAFLQIFNVIIIFVISISHILFLFYGWTSLNCVRIPMTVLTSQQCLWMVLPGPEQWLNG